MFIKVLNKETLKIEIIESNKISNKYLHVGGRDFTEEELKNFGLKEENNNIIKESKKTTKK